MAATFPPITSYLERIASATPAPSQHAEASEHLAAWIAEQYPLDPSLRVIVVCTGNSRRSILGSTLGNAIAARFGLTRLRFSSGGTDPSAFNPRTINALKEVGFRIEATGESAPPGKGGESNPRYRVAWSDSEETIEFSKHFADASNPKRGFAAIMVCAEANAECPVVPGASLRVAMPFDDPKSSDGSPEESAAYAQRRDEIAASLLAVLRKAVERMQG